MRRSVKHGGRLHPLQAFQAELHEIAVSVHRERYDRAVDEAIVDRHANESGNAVTLNSGWTRTAAAWRSGPGSGVVR